MQYDPALLVNGAVLVAHQVATLYSQNGKYASVRDAHGKGALSLTFEHSKQLVDVVENAHDAAVVYTDLEACQRLGDVALGAVTRDAERQRPVVVVDCVEAQLRVVVRGADDRRPYIEQQCELEMAQVKAKVVRPMGDARAQQLSDWARERVRDLNDDDERLLLCGRDQELDGASKFEVVRAPKFEEFIDHMQTAGYSMPANVRTMWDDVDPHDHVLLWIFNTDQQDDVDSMWITERRRPPDGS